VNCLVSAVAAAVLAVGLLAACGDDGSGSAIASQGGYCNDLRSAKQELDAIQGGDFGTLRETTDRMHRLADEAPEEVKDDWEVLVAGVDKLADAFDAAGLSDADMAALQSGNIPRGVDMAALQDLMAEPKGSDTPEFGKASANVSKHAKKECDVDLEA
jgi:hypothetical protein